MKRERVVAVGAGAIAEHWLAAVRAEELDLIAVVDLDTAKARKLASEPGFDCPVSDDLEAVLDQKPDLLIDITYPSARDAVSGRAIARGVPALCEKPMAGSSEQGERLVRAAREAGVLFGVSQSRRYESGPTTLRHAVASGLIGEVSEICCDFFLAAHFDDFEHRKADCPEERYAAKTTMRRREMDEPLLADMAIHHFDMARYVSGKDPLAVSARAFHPKGTWFRGNAGAVCTFDMSDDAIFSYRGNWAAEGCTTGWNGSWRIVGDRGTLIFTEGSPVSGQIVDGVGFRREARDLEIEQVAPAAFGMHGALKEFLACLRSGTPFLATAEDNLKSLSMMFGAIESSRQRREVRLSGQLAPA